MSLRAVALRRPHEHADLHRGGTFCPGKNHRVCASPSVPDGHPARPDSREAGLAGDPPRRAQAAQQAARPVALNVLPPHPSSVPRPAGECGPGDQSWLGVSAAPGPPGWSGHPNSGAHRGQLVASFQGREAGLGYFRGSRALETGGPQAWAPGLSGLNSHGLDVGAGSRAPPRVAGSAAQHWPEGRWGR